MKKIAILSFFAVVLLAGCSITIDPPFLNDMVVSDTNRFIFRSEFVEVVEDGDDEKIIVSSYYNKYSVKPETEPDMLISRKGGEGEVVIRDCPGYGELSFKFSWSENYLSPVSCSEGATIKFGYLELNVHHTYGRRPCLNLELHANLDDGRWLTIWYYKDL